MKLSSQLKKLLKKNDETVAQLARSVGISSKTIYSWLNNQNQSPRDLNALKEVCNHYGVSLDYILFDETKFEKKPILSDFKEELNIGSYEIVLRKTKP